MKLLCVTFVLCIVAFVSAYDAVSGHNLSGTSTGIRSGHSTLPKSKGTLGSTGHLTHKSHSVTSSRTDSRKTRPTVRESGKTVTYSRNVRTGDPKTTTSYSKTTTSYPKHQSPSHPTSTKSSKSSTTPTRKVRPTTGATKTITVSKGQTATAEVGWVVVGVGIGGFVDVIGGNVIDVAGGTIGTIEENSSGQDELKTSTTSTHSKSSSSPTASPTPYNIYPRRGSTPSQRSAFMQNLERIAQPGSVRSITGIRDRQLLWVASLTPDQASKLGRNSVVQALNVNRAVRVNLEGVSGGSTRPAPICPPESCSHQRRDGDILLQVNAHDDLKMFSQARGARLSELAGYAYDSMGGDEITVYVVTR